MKAASVVDIRKELEHLNHDSLKQLCLRLARFKLENKELLTYLLFEAEQEESYVQTIKLFIDNQFDNINTNSYFYIKKSVRKILRQLKKFSRYSNSKETEVQLLLHFCEKMGTLKPSIFKNKTLTNLYQRQILLTEKRLINLHEDLQFDYNEKLNNLKHL